MRLCELEAWQNRLRPLDEEGHRRVLGQLLTLGRWARSGTASGGNGKRGSACRCSTSRLVTTMASMGQATRSPASRGAALEICSKLSSRPRTILSPTPHFIHPTTTYHPLY